MSLDYATASKLLKFDSATGELFWLPREASMFSHEGFASSWNTKHAGKLALNYQHPSGYRYGGALGKMLKAHRVAWLLHYGDWPSGHIDHINGVRSDNRLINLRDVTRSENQRNIRRSRANKSGVVGVCWEGRKSKWLSRISVSGKTLHLGLFDDFQAAVDARKAAELKYEYHPNHGRAA